MRVAYLGGGFAGWQRQSARRTVQGTLEEALASLFRSEVRVVGAGRTDAGVHASGQIAHCDVPRLIPAAGLRAALNGTLPLDLRVLAVRHAPPTFHARKSARAKRYRYRLAWGAPLEPWEAQRTWQLSGPIAPVELAAAAARLVGTHDFAAFALSGHAGLGPRGTRRTVHRLEPRQRGRRMSLVVVGDGFLRGMVRRLVGALVEVGRGAQPPRWPAALLEDPTRRPPAPTAPAHGLTLEKVYY
jgi:tRNA pseudouridine38-40 synthase